MNATLINDIGLVCSICGESHKYSECSYVKITNYVPDNIIPTKAKLTLPSSLRIEMMSEGTYSVISTELIKKGTQYGPFEAKKLFTLDPEIIFPLKIFTSSDYFSEYYLDTNSENDCNWMMFVAPALNIEEQNLVCFQENEKIYYVSTCDINVGNFLKVWYSPLYAKKMNKNVLTPQISSQENQQLDLNSLLKKQQKLMERDTWTCKFCSIQEKDVIKFARHITEHYSMQIRKVCEICKSTFMTHKGLKKHLQLTHSDISSVKLNTKVDYMRNTKNERNIVKDALLGGPLLNDILTDSLDNTNLLLQQSDLSQFDMSNIENQNMLLENDNLNLSVDNLLSDNGNFNIDIDEEKDQYICDICLKSFAKLKLLVQHLQKHTGKYICNECLMIFCRNENLKTHKCNFKRPQFKCPLCQKLFSQKKYVARHMQSVHEKKHQCPKCKKIYYCDKEFREHNCLGVPDSEKEKFPCSVCNKIFFRESYLRKHMRIHMPKRIKKNNESIICEICPKTFQSLKYLHQHKKTHLEPSYACKICDKTFTRTDTLNCHIESCHSSETYSCTVCNKKCKTRKYLKIHMQTHSAIKKYKCSDCNQQFSLRSNMLQHYSNKHKKKCDICKENQCIHNRTLSHVDCYYECGLCKKAVKLRSSITRHIKKSHPNAVIDFIKITKAENTRTTNLDQNNGNIETAQNSMSIEKDDINTNLHGNRNTLEIDPYMFLKDKSGNSMQTLDNFTNGFENIVTDINSDNYPNSVFNKDEMSISIGNDEKTNAAVLDFNNFDLDLDAGLNMQQDLQISNQEVCLSMPELTDMDQNITLGENAYILDNGTIVEPLEQGNVVVYILDKKFVAAAQNI